MPFIRTYGAAMKLLSRMGTGTCDSECRKLWLPHFKYALKHDHWKLTAKQRKTLAAKMKTVSGRHAKVMNNHATTLKKYRTRKGPPYPANENRNKVMKGNDGHMYLSKANKNGVCSWKKIAQE